MVALLLIYLRMKCKWILFYVTFRETTIFFKVNVIFDFDSYRMAQSIKIMFAIAIFITHALQGYVPVDIIWNTYLDQKIQKRKIFWEYVCRTVITLATCKFTKGIPVFEF